MLHKTLHCDFSSWQIHYQSAATRSQSKVEPLTTFATTFDSIHPICLHLEDSRAFFPKVRTYLISSLQSSLPVTQIGISTFNKACSSRLFPSWCKSKCYLTVRIEQCLYHSISTHPVSETAKLIASKVGTLENQYFQIWKNICKYFLILFHLSEFWK